MIGFLDFWNFDFWISPLETFGFLDYLIFGFLDVLIFGFLDFWIFGSLDFWIFGLLDFWFLIPPPFDFKFRRDPPSLLSR